MPFLHTYFVCQPGELLAGFPQWRLPLPHTIRRDVANPFAKDGSAVSIETRAPKWTEEELAEMRLLPDKPLTARPANFGEFVEERLPRFIRARPHWSAEDFPDPELELLGQAMGQDPSPEVALFGPPSSASTVIERFRSGFVDALSTSEDGATRATARRWAEEIARRNGGGQTLFREPSAIARSWRFLTGVPPGVARSRKRMVVRERAVAEGRVIHSTNVLVAIIGLARQCGKSMGLHLLTECEE